ncbi:MAG: hypothetical protein U9Q21_02605 [Candidatus Auribacterota bacterium]|nr:hypothetical protein [Candidatus Auribacterota bacterium]
MAAEDSQILVVTSGFAGQPGTESAPIASRGWGIPGVKIEPILTRIEQKMKAALEGISINDGYYFNHGTVGQRDQAKVLYPAHYIDLLPEEENLDDPEGAHANAYINRDDWEITTMGKLQVKKAIPVEAIKIVLNRTLHDLKRVFGIDYHLGSSGCWKIQYRGCRRIFHGSGDILHPCKLITRWSTYYHQNRIKPTEACS